MGIHSLFLPLLVNAATTQFDPFIGPLHGLSFNSGFPSFSDLYPLYPNFGLNQLVQNNPKVTIENGKYEAVIYVNGFKPEEISVTVVNHLIKVEAKHEEEVDNKTGEKVKDLKNHLKYQFTIPYNVDDKAITSTISTDGVLTIEAPLKPEEKEQTIKIVESGKPAHKSEETPIIPVEVAPQEETSASSPAPTKSSSEPASGSPDEASPTSEAISAPPATEESN